MGSRVQRAPIMPLFTGQGKGLNRVQKKGSLPAQHRKAKHSRRKIRRNPIPPASTPSIFLSVARPSQPFRLGDSPSPSGGGGEFFINDSGLLSPFPTTPFTPFFCVGQAQCFSSSAVPTAPAGDSFPRRVSRSSSPFFFFLMARLR